MAEDLDRLLAEVDAWLADYRANDPEHNNDDLTRHLAAALRATRADFEAAQCEVVQWRDHTEVASKLHNEQRARAEKAEALLLVVRDEVLGQEECANELERRAEAAERERDNAYTSEQIVVKERDKAEALAEDLKGQVLRVHKRAERAEAELADVERERAQLETNNGILAERMIEHSKRADRAEARGLELAQDNANLQSDLESAQITYREEALKYEARVAEMEEQTAKGWLADFDRHRARVEALEGALRGLYERVSSTWAPDADPGLVEPMDLARRALGEEP